MVLFQKAKQLIVEETGIGLCPTSTAFRVADLAAAPGALSTQRD
jgi:hypothetical protein